MDLIEARVQLLKLSKEFVLQRYYDKLSMCGKCSEDKNLPLPTYPTEEDIIKTFNHF